MGCSCGRQSELSQVSCNRAWERSHQGEGHQIRGGNGESPSRTWERLLEEHTFRPLPLPSAPSSVLNTRKKGELRTGLKLCLEKQVISQKAIESVAGNGKHTAGHSN